MKRPPAVTTLLWMVLCLVTWNAIRMIATLMQWDILWEFAPHPGPIYIFATASLWTLGWLAVWMALRRRRVRARRYTLLIAFGYAAWLWLDRLLLQQSNPNWPFAAAATVIFLAFTAILIYHPRTTAYLEQRENNEQTNQDQESA